MRATHLYSCLNHRRKGEIYLKINRKTVVTVSLVVSMLLTFTCASVKIVPAVPPTTLYIDPTPVTAFVCSKFVVALNIKDVTNLYAWEVKLSFNPSQLECLGATEGPFLPPPTIWVPPVINNVAGTVHMACSRMVLPGQSGSGTLAYIEFHCEGPGECDLVFLYPETYLLDSNLFPIPHESVNGHVVQALTIDVELYPRKVVDLENPTSTQWHELHPSKTNYYHLMSWEPGYVLSPEDQIDMYAVSPPVKIYVLTEWVDPKAPICSYWREVEPTVQDWHLTSWEDNGDGFLSPCDQIDMTNLITEDVVWFHVQEISPPDPTPGPRTMVLDVKYWFQVDEVTVDMALTPIEIPGPQIFVEYKCGYWTFDPRKPICTKWNQIDPMEGPVRCLHLTSWYDNGDGVLDYCDIIDMTPLYPTPGPVEYYHVDSLTISLKLTPKPSPPVVPPPPGGPMYLESEISYYTFNLSNPVCTYWHEIYPYYSRWWHLSSWENFYGLSPSDQIVLALKDEFGEPTGKQAEYHVDKLTVAMNLTSTYDGREHIVKFEESLKEFKMYHWRDPVSTQWHEVNPEYCRQWHILAWKDDGDGYLGYCDLILMIDKHTGWEEVFHVESLSTDMWLTLKLLDVAVTAVETCKTVCSVYFHPIDIVYENYSVSINATVENQCDLPETFDVVAKYDGNTIQTKSVSLAAHTSTYVTFLWDTHGVAKGSYTITVEAVLPTDVDPGDNTKTHGPVKVTWLGDLDGDFDVDEDDLWAFCDAFIDYWRIHVKDPLCDFDDDCDIDEDDLWAFCDAFIDYWMH